MIFRRFLAVFSNRKEDKTLKYKLSLIQEGTEGYNHLLFLCFKRNQEKKCVSTKLRKHSMKILGKSIKNSIGT